MRTLLKRLIGYEKKQFDQLCRVNGLSNLSYASNKGQLPLLKSIFWEREYAQYFPFYQEETIVDIGAHYGYFSLFAHLNTANASRIIAVEPDTNNFQHLKANLSDMTAANVTAYHCAIGGENENVTLYKGDTVNHSIIANYAQVKTEQPTEQIAAKTLETLLEENNIERVGFLKMDCEGAEYAILEQTPASVFERISTISMEFHDLKDKQYTGEFIRQLLLTYGYQIVKFEHFNTSMNLNYGKIIGIR
jgi:FkbM family methyltransferase